MTVSGRAPSGQALVPAASSQQAVSTKGFDPSRDSRVKFMLELDRLWRTPKKRQAFEQGSGFDPLLIGIHMRSQIDSGYYAKYVDAFEDWAEDEMIDAAVRLAIQAEADRLLCSDRDLGDTLNGLLSDFGASELARLAILIHRAVEPFAIAIEARSDATGTGAAEGESAAIAQPQSPPKGE